MKIKLGEWLIILGIAMQFINIITYGLWEIDIDIFGALIFIIGLVMFIVKKEWRSKPRPSLAKVKGRGKTGKKLKRKK